MTHLLEAIFCVLYIAWWGWPFALMLWGIWQAVKPEGTSTPSTPSTEKVDILPPKKATYLKKPFVN